MAEALTSSEIAFECRRKRKFDPTSTSEVATFGSDTPLGRAGEPEEVATCFVFLASDDSSYITGQVLHPNGGRTMNG
jgi:NAD(P)-dependent dehydrogenase (short-subunit alcohol dehydrogenase family)